MIENPTIIELWNEAKEIYQRRKERGRAEFPTGLKFLDDITDGLHKGEIWVVAGRVGCGKTSLSLQMANNFAKVGKEVLFLSLEMKGWELMTRLFCEIYDIDFSDFLHASLPSDFKEKEAKFREYLTGINFEVFEFGYTFEEVQSILKSSYQGVKPDVIFIDFIQFIDWKRFNDERMALSEYIRKFKELAKLHNIGIVIVSQVRRLPSGSDYSRPIDLQDLKGTGSLEQMADKVVLIYKAIDQQAQKTRYFINLAKNRQGMTIEKEVNFIGKFYRFEEIDFKEVEETAEIFKGKIEYGLPKYD